MTGIYSIAGVSKQGHYKQLQSRSKRMVLAEEWVQAAHQLRKDHPQMGMRSLYDHIKPEGIGRDRFIELLASRGFQLKRKRSFKRTTYAHPSIKFPNLISQKELDGPNQVWVSDITYIRLGERFYYLTMIMDVYSRRIIGWSLSKSLGAESNLNALRMALRTRKGADLSNVVHHSDRGSQYCYGPYIKLLKSKGITPSMGNRAWENAHAERINGTIKLDYILPYHPQNWGDLKRKTSKAIVLYNQKRQHSSIQNMTPWDYEKWIEEVPVGSRPKYKINY